MRCFQLCRPSRNSCKECGPERCKGCIKGGRASVAREVQGPGMMRWSPLTISRTRWWNISREQFLAAQIKVDSRRIRVKQSKNYKNYRNLKSWFGWLRRQSRWSRGGTSECNLGGACSRDLVKRGCLKRTLLSLSRSQIKKSRSSNHSHMMTNWVIELYLNRNISLKICKWIIRSPRPSYPWSWIQWSRRPWAKANYKRAPISTIQLTKATRMWL